MIAHFNIYIDYLAVEKKKVLVSHKLKEIFIASNFSFSFSLCYDYYNLDFIRIPCLG